MVYTESFWTRLNAHFRSPEFIRCLYDYLNGKDLSTIDWKMLRRQNLTSTYYDLAARYAPLEAIYFEELSQMIRSGYGNDWEFAPSFIKPEGSEVNWNTSVRAKTKELFNKCGNWALERKNYAKSSPNQRAWWNKCSSELELPLRKDSKYHGYPTLSFIPKDIHEHNMLRKFIEADEKEEIPLTDEEREVAQQKKIAEELSARTFREDYFDF